MSNSDSTHIVCPHCAAVNRVPIAGLGAGPQCGRCHLALFTKTVLALTEQTFPRLITRNDGPIVVDFWAPWCGPCLAMAPAFAAAAASVEPHIRLAKVDTQAEATLAQSYSIRSIPTLVAFRGGREIARQSGALQGPQLIAWIKQACG